MTKNYMENVYAGGRLNPLGYSLQNLRDTEIRSVALPCRVEHRMKLVAWEEDFVAESCVLCGHVRIIKK